MKVLIVEDEPIVAEDLAQLAEAGGHEVVGVAAAASEARALAPLAPDLALVDINLKDGATGAHIAGDLTRRTGATVVLVTANIDQIPPSFCGAAGAIAKPFTSRAVSEVIAYAAGARGAGPRTPAPRDFIPAGGGPIWRMARASQ